MCLALLHVRHRMRESVVEDFSQMHEKRKGVGPESEDAFYASAGTLKGDHFSELVPKSAP
jgi:hypothetical protein